MSRRTRTFLFDLFVLLVGIAAGLMLLVGCATSRTDTQTDETRNRKTITKETKVHEGADPWRETIYREEISDEVARAEQSRTVSLPAAEALGGFLSGVSTGNPAIDLGIGLLTMFLGRKGLDKFRPKKAAAKEQQTEKA